MYRRAVSGWLNQGANHATRQSPSKRTIVRTPRRIAPTGFDVLPFSIFAHLLALPFYHFRHDFAPLPVIPRPPILQSLNQRTDARIRQRISPPPNRRINQRPRNCSYRRTEERAIQSGKQTSRRCIAESANLRACE